MARTNNNNTDFDNKKHNVFANGTRIVGNIKSDGDIRIDGEIEGEIKTNGRVVLGKTSLVNGTITCPNAEILGKFNGVLEIEDTLAIRDTAVVTGDLTTSKLTIDINAVFNGTCNMNSKDKVTEKTKITEKEKK